MKYTRKRPRALDRGARLYLSLPTLERGRPGPGRERAAMKRRQRRVLMVEDELGQKLKAVAERYRV